VEQNIQIFELRVETFKKKKNSQLLPLHGSPVSITSSMTCQSQITCHYLLIVHQYKGL